MRVVFCLQGEGRGHMTQAIALAAGLRAQGHEVVRACVGMGQGGRVPAFLSDGLGCPITSFLSPGLSMTADSRAIDVWQTAWTAGRLAGHLVRSRERVEAAVASARPDVVVNFYEPVTGMARLDPTPVVAIAHQYMFFHPRYPFLAGSSLQRRGLSLFTRLTARNAARLLALSLYPAPELPGHRLQVVPPLIRDEVYALLPRRDVPGFLLAYVWRAELVEEIREWCQTHPDVVVHCFLDHPRAVPDDPVLPNLTLHHLDGPRFLGMMARCSGIATTAGFETTAEAMILGKPLLMIPTHVEQQCNALDASLIGAGYAASTFDLDRLEHITPADQGSFRAWALGASDVIVAALEQVAGQGVRRGSAA